MTIHFFEFTYNDSTFQIQSLLSLDSSSRMSCIPIILIEIHFCRNALEIRKKLFTPKFKNSVLESRKNVFHPKVPDIRNTNLNLKSVLFDLLFALEVK